MARPPRALPLRLLRQGVRRGRGREAQPGRGRHADAARRARLTSFCAGLPSNTCSPMLAGPMPAPRLLICALVPRFALRVAMGGVVGDAPAALAPEPGGPPLIGEVNAAAATFGVRPGMRAGEAI